MGMIERFKKYTVALEEAHYLSETFGEFGTWLTEHGNFMHEC
jgi:hypothetical protein